MKNLENIDEKRLQEINGGGFGGAFIGAVFGAGAGALVGVASTIASGNPSAGAHIIGATAKKGATGGAFAGFLSGPF